MAARMMGFKIRAQSPSNAIQSKISCSTNKETEAERENVICIPNIRVQTRIQGQDNFLENHHVFVISYNIRESQKY